MPYVNNKGTDQPAHPRSLISTFSHRCLDSIIALVSISEISRLSLVAVAEQTGLSQTSAGRGYKQKLPIHFVFFRLIRHMFINYHCLFSHGFKCPDSIPVLLK